MEKKDCIHSTCFLSLYSNVVSRNSLVAGCESVLVLVFAHNAVPPVLARFEHTLKMLCWLWGTYPYESKDSFAHSREMIIVWGALYLVLPHLGDGSHLFLHSGVELEEEVGRGGGLLGLGGDQEELSLLREASLNDFTLGKVSH